MQRNSVFVFQPLRKTKTCSRNRVIREIEVSLSCNINNSYSGVYSDIYDHFKMHKTINPAIQQHKLELMTVTNIASRQYIFGAWYISFLFIFVSTLEPTF